MSSLLFFFCWSSLLLVISTPGKHRVPSAVSPAGPGDQARSARSLAGDHDHLGHAGHWGSGGVTGRRATVGGGPTPPFPITAVANPEQRSLLGSPEAAARVLPRRVGGASPPKRLRWGPPFIREMTNTHGKLTLLWNTRPTPI